MKKGVLIFWAAIILVIALGIGASFLKTSSPGQYDQLAQCIKKQGVQFYGAFWCPHCQRTKALFGASAKYLPYIECSNASGTDQTQVCKDKKIMSYPTWIRPDGATMNGENTIEQWAAFSGCTVDGQTTEFSVVANASSTATTSSQVN